MKEKGIFKYFKKELVILIVIFMILIPLPPAIVSDIFISLNIIFCILFFILSVHISKIEDFTLLPLLIIFSALLNMYINISVAIHILFKGESFDGQIINNMFLVIYNQEFDKILIQLVLYIMLTFINIVFFLNSINEDILIENNESHIDNCNIINNTINLLERIFIFNFWIILIILLRSLIVEDLINFEFANDGLSINISSSGGMQILDNLKIYTSFVMTLGCNSLLHSIVLSLSIFIIKRKITQKEEKTVIEDVNFY